MTARLADPVQLGSLTLNNRLYRAPVLEGAGGKKNAWKIYAKHFVPNIQSGLGLVIQGNTIVLAEGRTSLGMTAIKEKATMMALAPLTEAVHQAGGRIITQLGHGGSYSLEAWHVDAKAARTSAPYAVSKLPLWLRAIHSGVHILSTSEVTALIERFGVVAAWAREAGYDGVQLAASNAKLLHQFLSPTYNKRKDRFGGSVENRTRFVLEIRKAIAREAGNDFPVLLKYTALEKTPFGRGIRLEDGVQIGKLAQDAGFTALTPVQSSALPNTALCRGGYPGRSFDNSALVKRMEKASGRRVYVTGTKLNMWVAAKKYPFKPLWNRPVFAAISAAVDIPVFAVGGIRTPQEAAEILASGDADLIGIGRPFYTEPDLALRFLAADGEKLERPLACQSCNRCIVPQILGLPGICYNAEVNQAAKAGRKTSSGATAPAPPA